MKIKKNNAYIILDELQNMKLVKYEREKEIIRLLK